eukprot:scaffold16723_cov143-Isochrysis_galbana.AAC.13
MPGGGSSESPPPAPSSRPPPPPTATPVACGGGGCWLASTARCAASCFRSLRASASSIRLRLERDKASAAACRPPNVWTSWSARAFLPADSRPPRVGIRPTCPVASRCAKSCSCASSRAICSADLKDAASRLRTVCHWFPPSRIAYIDVSSTCLPQMAQLPLA